MDCLPFEIIWFISRIVIHNSPEELKSYKCIRQISRSWRNATDDYMFKTIPRLSTSGQCLPGLYYILPKLSNCGIITLLEDAVVSQQHTLITTLCDLAMRKSIGHAYKLMRISINYRFWGMLIRYHLAMGQHLDSGEIESIIVELTWKKQKCLVFHMLQHYKHLPKREISQYYMQLYLEEEDSSYLDYIISNSLFDNYGLKRTLFTAIVAGKSHVFTLLFKYKNVIASTYWSMALRFACSGGFGKIAKLLLKEDIIDLAAIADSLLLGSIWQRRKKTIRLLLKEISIIQSINPVNLIKECIGSEYVRGARLITPHVQLSEEDLTILYREIDLNMYMKMTTRQQFLNVLDAKRKNESIYK